MMVRGAALALLAALGVSGAAAAETGSTLVLPGGNGEILALTLPAGWTRSFAGTEGSTTVVEWRRADPARAAEGSITVTRIGGLGGSDPADFIRESADALKQDCDDVVQGQVRNDPAGTVRTALGCTRRKADGQGEMQLLHIAVGREAIYVARRIWPLAGYDKAHLPLSSSQIAEGGADIDDLRLCSLSGVGTACPAELAAALKDKVTDLSPLVLKAGP
ncbi:hypothetical protein [Inquilinus sp. Marseille-Q2685]|uniref:hypothetical protein n=1 Tax=Inquilinus sp. Marseille-Q2685 TaxID=2866581 RepID=UPI001CE42665|nr:hypothetical protein [Inquilinus sp. Marseille-Q2685]